MKHILRMNLSVIVINLTYKIELNEMARILIIFNVSFNVSFLIDKIYLQLSL